MTKQYLIFGIISLSLLAVSCTKPAQLNLNNGLTSATNSNSSVNANEASEPASNSSVYINTAYKISLDYTGLHMLSKAPGSYIPAQSDFGDQGQNLLTLYLDPKLSQGTNLESAWFNLAINDKLNYKTCYAQIPQSGFTTGFVNKRVVQGNTWYYAKPNPTGDAAAGHNLTAETYRLYKNDLCYEVRLGAAAFVKENLERPESIKEVDRTKILSDLGAVFNNLKIK